MTDSGATTRHRVAGLAALIALAVLAAAVPTWGGLREAAVVEAGRTFRLTAPAAERYEWTLTDGVVPGSQLISRRSLTLERGEVASVEMATIELASLGAAPALEGGEVRAGQLLATLRLPHSERALAELRAEREALLARRALLEAGARDQDVAWAREQLALVEARRDRARAAAERLRGLAPQGAIPRSELEDAELKEAERAREVAVARAGLVSARSPARPEAISEVDARLAMIDAGLAELGGRLSAARIQSPISGVVDRGGDAPGVLLTVYELDPVYLHVPVSEAHFHRLHPGDPVRFATAAAPGRFFSGEVVAVGPGATVLDGEPVVWVSARVSNPRGLLRPGMTGEIELSPQAPGSWGVLPALRAALEGP